ncbi:MAG: endonuclease NucS domain-containing protein [Candidatus Hodarchaeota archaeon]
MQDRYTQLATNPSLLKQQLDTHLRKKMIIIFGRCSALFDGRIKSTLKERDRILLVKKDETILLHNSIGVKPVQWQRPGAGRINFTLIDNNLLRMETYRPKTDESFFITFTEIYHSSVFDTIEEDVDALIIGHEKDLIDYLAQHPETIEPEMRVIECEKDTPVGSIDIFAIDSSNNHTIIEVKKQAATPADVHQLRRYVDYFHDQGQPVRGILVANNFPKRVVKYLKNYRLEACAVPWQDIFPTIKRPSSISRSRSLEEFF